MPTPFRKKRISPSILSADFSHLGSEIEAVIKAGAEWIHIDVMDGHFVENLTMGAPIVKSIRKFNPKVFLDVHLMIERPEKYLDDFIKAGSNAITIHVESTQSVESCLKKIRNSGIKAGITLRPRTVVEALLPYLELVDLILVMTVEPGFGGQVFMDDQIKKIQYLRNIIDQKNLPILLEVDGGVNENTIPLCRDADVIVAGSYIFKNDYNEAISFLKKDHNITES